MPYTDDPLRDFLSHDAEQQDALDRTPRCENCGKPIQDENLYHILGYIFCEECIETEFKKSTDNFVESGAW